MEPAEDSVIYAGKRQEPPPGIAGRGFLFFALCDLAVYPRDHVAFPPPQMFSYAVGG
jgi:hypothetical protein